MNETYGPEYPTVPRPPATDGPIMVGVPVYGTRFWTWMYNDIPVITTPDAGVDNWNAETMRRKLLAAAAYSPVVIVDATETLFTAEAMRVLDEVGRQLEDDGGELRLVLGSSKRIHHLHAARCHRHLQVYLNLYKALRDPHYAAESWPQPMAA